MRSTRIKSPSNPKINSSEDIRRISPFGSKWSRVSHCSGTGDGRVVQYNKILLKKKLRVESFLLGQENFKYHGSWQLGWVKVELSSNGAHDT